MSHNVAGVTPESRLRARMFTTQAQRRAMRLLGIGMPITKGHNNGMSLTRVAQSNSYRIAHRLLQAAKVPGDGLPGGFTWREASKLTDADLLSLLYREQYQTVRETL